MKLEESNIGKTVRIRYDNKSVKGEIRKIDGRWVVLRTCKEYHIPIEKVTEVTECKQ